MKIWIKRAAGLAIIITGAVLFVRHVLKLLDWPHLYPDLRQFGAGNVAFLGLTVLLAAFAWIAGAYLLLNAEKKLPHQLISAAAFILLLTLSGLCATKAVGEIPCSYTSSLAACREEFDAGSFRVRGKPLYPGYPMGELTGYARYEKGEVLAESVTRSYDQDGFVNEAARLAALGVPGFRFSQDPRERESTCYELRLGDSLWQVLLVPKTKTVTYSRFNQAEELPGFAPQPTEKPGNAEPATVPSTELVTEPSAETAAGSSEETTEAP